MKTKLEIETNQIKNNKNTITIDTNILEEIKKYCILKGLKIGKFIEKISLEYIKNNNQNEL
jgi:hypothetical protein